MIKIRSTEKLATSNSKGLCDVVRTLSQFTFDLEKNVVKTIVTDQLFQEQDIETDGEIVTERIIVEQRQGVAYEFPITAIDQLFQAVGTSITKTKGFSTGLFENLTTVLNYQTKEATRQTMTEWIADTEHVIVTKFTEV